MADLSDVVDPVVTAIYKTYEIRNASEEPRAYLGGSIVGKSCARALYYDFRWGSRETFDGRLHCLFDTGHRAEARFVADLRAIGATVYDADPSTGQQFNYKDHGGHMRGSMDGAAVDIPGGGKQWHCCEFKTHSAKSFADLKKHGVQKSKPMHYAQMQVYAGWAGLTRMLYLAVNKDTDELYSERLHFDPVAFEKYRAKAEAIIFATEPPARLSEDPTWYECKWCSHHAICHSQKVPALSCRTCCYATPEREGDGRWSCNNKMLGTDDIPLTVQRKGCGEHLPLPFFISFAETVDAGDDWILFRRKDNGRHFVVCGQTAMPPIGLIEKYDHPGLYHSTELSAGNNSLIGDAHTDKIREAFGGRIVG